VPGSDDEDTPMTPATRKERPPPLGPGISSNSMATSLSSGTNDGLDRSRANANYRERSASRGLPNIEIPPFLPPNPNLDLVSANSLVLLSSSTAEDSSQILQIPSTSKPPINRKRSQSSVTGQPSRTALVNQHDRNLAAHGNFQFPFPPNGDLSLPIVQPLRTHNKASSNHTSASSNSTLSPGAHQTTYSLDASASGLASRRMPPAGLLPAPPSMHRARSANAVADTYASAAGSKTTGDGLPALSRRPGMSQQASVTVMEHVPSSPPPLVPPSKPFARPVRDRSGSGSSRLSDGNISQNLGLPGLKDVLKVMRSASFIFESTEQISCRYQL
jgi:protein-serine/threonine kinase